MSWCGVLEVVSTMNGMTSFYNLYVLYIHIHVTRMDLSINLSVLYVGMDVCLSIYLSTWPMPGRLLTNYPEEA